ncbi:hypothetical protein C7R54_13415 [Achromobacter aloeverae]|uniref:Preprotein translocase subunit SecD n=2 Tax=Achromobacter aloeverae TaxID=1750518 RepID=A0A4Q1HLV9_9BURK|nr:hypothetical protein C7R54_13415 [Achromobacter aloeverae]
MPRATRYSVLAALFAAGMGALPAAQAFQAVPEPLIPESLAGLPPSWTAKPPAGAKSGARNRLLAQLSSAPLVLTVAHAAIREGQPGEQSTLEIRLAPESRQALAQLTSENVGRSVVLRAAGEVLTTVVIRGPIESGNLLVTPGMDEHGMTEAKMRQIAGKLSSGKDKLEISLLPRL